MAFHPLLIPVVFVASKALGLGAFLALPRSKRAVAISLAGAVIRRVIRRRARKRYPLKD